MSLFLILALMTAAAIFAVLWPLSRRPHEAAGGHDVAVYRDQLDEIERDRKSGLIGDIEADAARLEVSRRLLAAADAGPTAKAGSKSAAAATWRLRAAALVALLALPALAGALYIKWGSPHLPGAPLAGRLDSSPEQRSVESMVAQVEAHLERQPDDGRGWEVVAPVYMRMARFNDAVRARANALRLLGATGDREADLGEAMIAAANGVVTADAKASFDRALKAEPTNPKAQYFTGLAAEQDGRPQDAARIWRVMLAGAPANAPFRPLLQQSLARVESKGGIAVEPKGPQPGPTAEDVQAAQQLTPAQRAEMVRGMVDRLAERLKTDASDFDGWVQLIRAYVVIREAGKAREAIAEARNAFGGDAEKQKRLKDVAESLGLAVEPTAPQPGPTAEDVAAAQQLTPEQRTEMVRGMVDRLAERLKTDSSDIEGWLRLVRAYVVMGDADKARETLAKARTAIGADAEKGKRLDALAESLGIKS